ncbi:MAG: hypothetical protein CL911_07725 [Deltaproteobacteria bacterium]|nr:hypothetical protein [Deltaproteobacteria bacterium]
MNPKRSFDGLPRWLPLASLELEDARIVRSAHRVWGHLRTLFPVVGFTDGKAQDAMGIKASLDWPDVAILVHPMTDMAHAARELRHMADIIEERGEALLARHEEYEPLATRRGERMHELTIDTIKAGAGWLETGDAPSRKVLACDDEEE